MTMYKTELGTVGNAKEEVMKPFFKSLESGPGFLTLTLLRFLCSGGCFVLCRMSSSIPSLHPL